MFANDIFDVKGLRLKKSCKLRLFVSNLCVTHNKLFNMAITVCETPLLHLGKYVASIEA